MYHQVRTCQLIFSRCTLDSTNQINIDYQYSLAKNIFIYTVMPTWVRCEDEANALDNDTIGCKECLVPWGLPPGLLGEEDFPRASLPKGASMPPLRSCPPLMGYPAGACEPPPTLTGA